MLMDRQSNANIATHTTACLGVKTWIRTRKRSQAMSQPRAGRLMYTSIHPSIDRLTRRINNSMVLFCSVQNKDTSTAACLVVLRLALLSCSQSSQQTRNDLVLCKEVKVHMAAVELKVVGVDSTVTKTVEVESGHGGRNSTILQDPLAYT